MFRLRFMGSIWRITVTSAFGTSITFRWRTPQGTPSSRCWPSARCLPGGVFERFPTLRAAFLEGLCSWAPSWLYCLDERWEKFGNERRYGLKHPPSYYFRRQCFLSVDPDEELVVDTIKALGDENIVISTDWPHGDSSFPQALNHIPSKIDGISDQIPAQDSVAPITCARLLQFARVGEVEATGARHATSALRKISLLRSKLTKSFS